jgi:hypothetical protein
MIIQTRYRDIPWEEIDHPDNAARRSVKDRWLERRGMPLRIIVPAFDGPTVQVNCTGPFFLVPGVSYDGHPFVVCPHIGEIVLGVALIGSSVADGLSTRAVLSRCPPPTCWERNPLTAGKMLWPALAGGTTAAVLATRELKRRGKKWWWVIPAVGIVGHSLAARNNMRLK